MRKRTITMTVGRSPENEWRRNNLMRVPGLVEEEKYFSTTFQFVEHFGKDEVYEVTLTYHILK